MSRRSWGTGSIEVRRGGYRARVPDGVGGRHAIGLFPTQEDAAAALADYWAERAKRGDLTRGQTVAEFGEEWFRREALSGARRSLSKDESRFRSRILTASLAHKPIAELSSADVLDWLIELSRSKALLTRREGDKFVTRPVKRKVSRQTVRHCRNLLASICRDAVLRTVIAENPCHGVPLPAIYERDDAWTYLTMPEIDLLIACEEMPLDKKAIYLTAVFSGPRMGELWGLRRDRLQLRGPRPHIPISYSHDDATKSGRVRYVPLLEPACVAIEAWLAVAPKSEFVFPARRGGRRREDDSAGWEDHPERINGELVVRPGWKTRAGITRHVRFHDLRHTCGSWLAMGRDWVDRGWIARALRIEEVRDWLGHSSVTETERYSHLAPEALHSLVPGNSPHLAPAVQTTEDDVNTETRMISAISAAARNAGVEPATFGSGGRYDIRASIQEIGKRGRSWDELRPQILRVVERQETTRQIAEALALAALREAGPIAAAAVRVFEVEDAALPRVLVALAEALPRAAARGERA